MSRISTDNTDVVGVILAGGLSRRMEGGKALAALAGKPMIAHVIERMRPQLGTLVINANGDPAPFAGFGLPVAPDVFAGHAGPLAGLLTGMYWAREHAPKVRWIVTTACDTPFLPASYVETLRAATGGIHPAIAIAASDSGHHHVLGIWAIALAGDLAEYLETGGRKVQDWAERHPHFLASFPAEGGVDPFYNINTPDDFAVAEQLMRGEVS